MFMLANSSLSSQSTSDTAEFGAETMFAAMLDLADLIITRLAATSPDGLLWDFRHVAPQQWSHITDGGLILDLRRHGPAALYSPWGRWPFLNCHGPAPGPGFLSHLQPHCHFGDATELTGADGEMRELAPVLRVHARLLPSSPRLSGRAGEDALQAWAQLRQLPPAASAQLPLAA
jgi:hypothetical protein